MLHLLCLQYYLKGEALCSGNIANHYVTKTADLKQNNKCFLFTETNFPLVVFFFGHTKKYAHNEKR